MNTTEKRTSQLNVGDRILLSHGMVAEIVEPMTLAWTGDFHYTDARVETDLETLRGRDFPVGWLGTAADGSKTWTVQGNDRARWSVITD